MRDYKFNGINIRTTYGVIIGPGRASADTLEKPADSKPVLSHDWPEEDGIEYDLTAPTKLAARQIRLDGFFTATSRTDYAAKKIAFEAVLRSAYIWIYSPEIEKTVAAKFRSFSTWERLTKIFGNTNIVTRISMEFDEVLGLTLPTYNLFYGPSASVPVTSDDVNALTQASFSSSITFDTGTTNRIFNIVKQHSKNLVSVTDLDAGSFGNITSQYTLQSTISISGVDYDIFTMTNAVPYSINHRHQFTLS